MADDANTEVVEKPAPDAAPAPEAPVGEAAPEKGGGEAPKTGEVEPPKSALEAAERVMAKAKEDSPPSENPQKADATPEAKADTPKGDKPDEADAKLPFKDHPRWKETTSELRILRVAKTKNEEAINELTPKAEAFTNLHSWLGEQGLAREDFSNTLAIAAAVKNDPQKAYEMLRPIMDQLEAAVGERLPDDLQKKVNAGLVDEETAKDLARARGRATVTEAQLQTSRERTAREAEEREASAAQEQANTVVGGIVAHIEGWAKRDPDAGHKRSFVEEAVENELRRLEVAGTPPQSVEAATKIVDGVIQRVSEKFRSAVPRPQPKSPLLPHGAGNPSTTPVPKTSLEAATMALRVAG